MVKFTANDIPPLDGKVIIVTGGNVGLGKETVSQLGKHNPAKIYIASRSQSRSEAAIKELQAENPQISPLAFLPLDLSSFASIKAATETFVRQESRLDLVVANAGIMMVAPGLTADGYEIQFGTNHMGHALFIQRLLPLMHSTRQIAVNVPRIVIVSSGSIAMVPTDIYPFDALKTNMASRRTTQRYTISKTANFQYARVLSEKNPDLDIVCVHPGMVNTGLSASTDGFFLRWFNVLVSAAFGTSASIGALNQIWAAVSPDVKTGGSYGPVGVEWKGSAPARKQDVAEQLYEWTQKELAPHVP
ncbi:hypothetical protein I316_06259 [Kwoniella heveanensis BCC8398]|uniref:Oxidoreductase n=1 Tax=Kwoniella heveanensis BCC8398 TaxID=1296120 RepID=A0A1B9GM99_9TREE|nr:hypothetical protein I316_06259 [Kwoniella heveanensis BCC8398]